MRSTSMTCITRVALFMTLAIGSPLAAQKNGVGPQHHHYKLIDLGTFGGPNSWINSLNVTDQFGFSTVFYNNALVGNNRGVFVGFADTSEPDPHPKFCYTLDCFVAHAFQWRNGITTDLGALPGGASSAGFWINQSD